MAGFSVPKICCLLDVTEITLRRRLRENEIKIRDKYSNISNDDLDTCIFQILQDHPMIGKFSSEFKLCLYIILN